MAKKGEKSVLMELQALPPQLTLALWGQAEQWLWEGAEHFQKQSYRNRYLIRGANGIQALTLPVCKANSRQKIRDTRLDNSSSWQREHVRALEAAYRSSPFFDYYFPRFEWLYQDSYTFCGTGTSRP